MSKREAGTNHRLNVTRKINTISQPIRGLEWISVIYRFHVLTFSFGHWTCMSYDIIQICHAGVGILMECLPEGGWFSRGRSPRENHPSEGRHSFRIPTLAWHICFIIPNKPQFGKISMTASRSSENGGRFAGGNFIDGQDGMANLCKPIKAYDFHVRYNKIMYCKLLID